MKLFFLGGSGKGVAKSFMEQVRHERKSRTALPSSLSSHQLDSNRVVSRKKRGSKVAKRIWRISKDGNFLQG